MAYSFFASVYYHPGLSAKNYEEITNAHTQVEFAQNALLLEIGKTAQEFYVIEKGLFRSYLYDLNGKEVTTGFYCPNDILIESMSLFQRRPSHENFQAISTGLAWKIDFNTFNNLLQKIEGLKEWGRLWATNELF